MSGHPYDRALGRMANGKVAVVTGASSGIGHALAKRLGDAGATALLVARSTEKLEETKRAIEENGGAAFLYTCDLSNTEDAGRLVRDVLSDHGHVDLLINNAGRSIRRSVHRSYDRIHDYERTMQLNFFGSLQLILGFLPGMRERGDGQIINVSTIATQVNTPRYSAYVSSKAALDAFSRSIAGEVLRDGVTLTTIYMPLVKTPMMDSTTVYDKYRALTPDQAVNMIVNGMVHRKKHVGTKMGAAFQFAYSVSPKFVDRVLNAGYELFPESGDKNEEYTPPTRESRAFGKFLRTVMGKKAP